MHFNLLQCDFCGVSLGALFPFRCQKIATVPLVQQRERVSIPVTHVKQIHTLAGKDRGVSCVTSCSFGFLFRHAFRHLSLSPLPLFISFPSCSTSHSHRQGRAEACYFLRRAESTFTHTSALKHTYISKHCQSLSHLFTKKPKCVCV